MTVHDKAGCMEEPCIRCEDFERGYTEGKNEGYFESAQAILHAELTDRCECSHCVQLRAVVIAMRELTPS